MIGDERHPVGVVLHHHGPHAVVLGSDGRIYVMGGTIDGYDYGTTTVEAYDPARNMWTGVADVPESCTICAKRNTASLNLLL